MLGGCGNTCIWYCSYE